MLSVASNYGSSLAAVASKHSQYAMDKSIERLSTGKRINKAKDDVAGQAIVTRLNAEVKSLARATKNASDAQSMIDTMESGLKAISQVLLRMRELALQSLNETLSDADRYSLDLEFNELIWHLERNTPNLCWGGKKLFSSNGTLLDNPFIFQIGTGGDESGTISVPISQGVVSVGSVIGGISAAGLNLIDQIDNIQSIGGASVVISKIDIAIAAYQEKEAKLGLSQIGLSMS